MPHGVFLSLFLSLVMVTSIVRGEGGEKPRLNPESLRAAQLVEDAFAEVVNLAKPAVVVITNKQIAPRRQEMPEDFYRFFGLPYEPQAPGRGWNRRPRRERPEPAGKGSGVLISAAGFLVTNYHVIQNQAYLEVRTSDGLIYDNEKDKDAVRVVGIDPETDLAVLQIGGGQRQDFPFLTFADSEALRVGQWAIAIGAPFNLDYSVTIGSVSQKGRYDTGMSNYENYIQTDASINPGNSGGPLLNIRGEIIGINQFIMTGGMSRGSIGLGFAIASNMVRQVSDSLINNGEMIRPYIGIAMQELDEALARQEGVDFGVLVSEVLSGEGADKAGVKAGDVIQKIGDREVRRPHDLLMAVAQYAPGDKIPLALQRSGKTLTLQVVAGKRQSEKVQAGGDGPSGTPSLDSLGLRLETSEGRVIVAAVDPRGPAASGADPESGTGGLQAGDTILEVNRQPVQSVSEVIEALGRTSNDTVVFYVERRRGRGPASRRLYIPVPLE